MKPLLLTCGNCVARFSPSAGRVSEPRRHCERGASDTLPAARGQGQAGGGGKTEDGQCTRWLGPWGAGQRHGRVGTAGASLPVWDGLRSIQSFTLPAAKGKRDNQPLSVCIMSLNPRLFGIDVQLKEPLDGKTIWQEGGTLASSRSPRDRARLSIAGPKRGSLPIPANMRLPEEVAASQAEAAHGVAAPEAAEPAEATGSRRLTLGSLGGTGVTRKLGHLVLGSVLAGLAAFSRQWNLGWCSRFCLELAVRRKPLHVPWGPAPTHSLRPFAGLVQPRIRPKAGQAR